MPEKPFSDPLVRQRTFPEAAQIFSFRPVGLADAIGDALVVVDTNVLLVPYGTGSASLNQIRKTLERLVRENRLRVPGQVAREFADNRVEKIKTLFQQLSRKRDINLARSEYPVFEKLPEYVDVTKQESEIIKAIENYRKALARLLETVATWQGDDPVANLYRELFTPPIVVDPAIDRNELLTELAYRQEHQIPPGYKDANNKYSGVGDLLIWKSILKIGRDESRNLIFVSGDEKTDWRYQSENRALSARAELVEEYRIASGGKSLLIINFAELLQQFGASTTIVEEVRKEEEVVASTSMKAVSAATDGVRLTPNTLKEYLLDRYPDRVHSSLAECRKLLRELKAPGIRTLAALEAALAEAESLFRAREERRISSGEGGRFADVGVVRVSLRLLRRIP